MCDSGDRILMNYDRFNLFSLEKNLTEYFKDYIEFRKKADKEEMEPFDVKSSINTNSSSENKPSSNESNELNLEDKLTKGKVFFLEQKYTEAVKVFRELMQYPDYKWQCIYYSACCYILQEKYCEAMLFLNKIITQKEFPKKFKELGKNKTIIINMYKYCAVKACIDVDLEEDDTNDEKTNSADGDSTANAGGETNN